MNLQKTYASLLTADLATVFFTVKNLFDRTFTVDRSRGLLPGIPRLIHAGVSLVL